MKKKDLVYEYYIQTFRDLCLCIGMDRADLESNMIEVVKINNELKDLYKRFEDFRNYEWEDFYFYFKKTDELYCDREFFVDLVEASILELNYNYEWLDHLWFKILEYESK